MSQINPPQRPFGDFTYQLDVHVAVKHVKEESTLEKQVFAYYITLTNTSDIPVQVIARHWIIDDHGVITVVRGLGVIGQQPLIQPNERYSYQSFCHLSNKVGTMKGALTCIAEDGFVFEAPVDEFLLVSDEAVIH